MATQDRSQTSGGQLDQVKQTAAEKTSDVRQKVSEKAGGRLREQADQRSTQVGEQVETVAEVVRQGSETLREKGMAPAADALETVSDKVEELSTYLNEGNADRFLGDFESFGRGKPWAVLGATAAVGFLASRLVKATSTKRVEATRPQWSTENLSRSERTLPTTGGVGAIPATTGYPTTGAVPATTTPGALPTTGGAPLTGAASRGNGYSIDDRP